MKKKSFIDRFKAMLGDFKANPDAFKSAIMSAFIMGSGQIRNKQKVKAAVFLGVLFFFILIELFTGGYIYMFTELSQYPGENIYIIRDYGGIFSKGLWGLFTLGKVVAQTMYRGNLVSAYNKVIPWLSADNSVSLLGQGLIAIVLLSLFAGVWITNVRDAYTSRKIILSSGKIETGKQYIKRIWVEMFPFIILLPTLVMVLFFIVIPFLFSFLLAFTNYTNAVKIPLNLIKWTGFNTFTKIASDAAWVKIFLSVVGWTFLYAIMASFTCYIMGMINAIVIESRYVKAKKLWRTLLIVPWAIPSMISLMVFRNVFDLNGLANQLLNTLKIMGPVSNFLHTVGLQGVIGDPIYWFIIPENGNLAKAVILMVNLWLGAPYFMMLITGVLTTLPKDLYEAAAIDGATAWQSFRRITLPLIIRATLPAIIMTFTFNFNNFGAIYFLTGGGPGWPTAQIPISMYVSGGVPGQTDILISWIYKLSFNNNAQLYNIAAVYSILIFLFIGFISVYNLSKSKGLWEDD